MNKILTDSIPPKLIKTRLIIGLFYFLSGVVFASWANRIPDIKNILNLSDAQLGSILFAIPLGQLFMMPVSGYLVNRLRSKICLAISIICYSLSLFLCGIITEYGNFYWIFGGLFLFGCSGNLTNISVNTQGVGIETLYQRSIMATFHGLWSLAGFLTGVGSSFLISIGISPWQHFLCVLILNIILLLFFINGTLPKDIYTKEKKSIYNQPKIQTQKTKYKLALQNPFIFLLGILASICMACEGIMYDWSSIYFTDIVRPDQAFIRLGYISSMFAMALGRFIADYFIIHFGKIKIIQFCSILVTVGLGFAIGFPYLIPATLGFLLVGFGVSAVVPICYSLSGQAEGISVSRALAAISTIGFLGFLIGPPVIGLISQVLGSLRWAFLVIAIMSAGTTFLAPLLKKWIIK